MENRADTMLNVKTTFGVRWLDTALDVLDLWIKRRNPEVEAGRIQSGVEPPHSKRSTIPSVVGGVPMLQFESKKGTQLCDGVTRRDFLRVGTLAAGAVGLSLADLARLQEASAASHADDVNCILLFLVGGPSHLDTWDLKPEAPDNVRGPFQPIQTNVPGIAICEHFPLMARMANQYSLVRSMHHQAAPIHETGQQLLQTGYLSQGGLEYPHYGSVLSFLRGPRPGRLPPSVVLPGPIVSTGVSVGHGQTAGYLGPEHEPFLAPDGSASHLTVTASDPARLPDSAALVDAVDNAQRCFDAAQSRHTFPKSSERAFGLLFAERAKRAFNIGEERDAVCSRYGMNTFGQSCLLARRLVEHGVRFVTVNMFDTVFDQITWDCHADGGSLATDLNDYKEVLCPMFDLAYTALLEDLEQRGMLNNTLVLAMGEFGRTPRLNPRGGRDHWPGCWTILFAGAGVSGGQIIGSSDKIGSEPADRPVSPEEVAATVYEAMGVDLSTRLPGPDGRLIPLVQAPPIQELTGA
jgi:uncharacterized protein (DUF1501 family)